jgi:hypothetical protein
MTESIDPIAVGGAVGGMTAGEVIGGAIGGLLGAVAGPGGAVIGAGLGAFAGSSVAVKLGYDVAHEIAHPKDADPNASLGDRARGVAKSTVARAGDAIGGGIGAAGGALVGGVMAGPMGASFGSFLGEAIAGDLGEERAAKLYVSTEQRLQGVPETERPPEPGNGPEKPDATRWLANVARDTATESGAVAALGAFGRLIGGETGRVLGKRAGTVLAKHLRWPSPSKQKPKNLLETPTAPDAIAGAPEFSNPQAAVAVSHADTIVHDLEADRQVVRTGDGSSA